jgi:hypothetical protein
VYGHCAVFINRTPVVAWPKGHLLSPFAGIGGSNPAEEMFIYPNFYEFFARKTKSIPSVSAKENYQITVFRNEDFYPLVYGPV